MNLTANQTLSQSADGFIIEAVADNSSNVETLGTITDTIGENNAIEFTEIAELKVLGASLGSIRIGGLQSNLLHTLNFQLAAEHNISAVAGLNATTQR